MPGPQPLELIEIRRRGEDFARRGFLVGEGSSLLAIHQVNDSYRLDGYCVMRRDAILSVKRRFRKRSLIQAALRLKKQEPKPLASLTLHSMRAAAETAQELCGVLVIHREKVQPGEVEVGALRLTTESTYVLRWLSTLAKWEADDRRFRYRDITLLEFGTEYDQTLLAVAAERDG
jgi:hypothetical protein